MARKNDGASANPKQNRTDVDCRAARPKFDGEGFRDHRVQYFGAILLPHCDKSSVTQGAVDMDRTIHFGDAGRALLFLREFGRLFGSAPPIFLAEPFQHAFPYERSDLSHWRKQLGDKLGLFLGECLRWRMGLARYAAKTSSRHYSKAEGHHLSDRCEAAALRGSAPNRSAPHRDGRLCNRHRHDRAATTRTLMPAKSRVI